MFNVIKFMINYTYAVVSFSALMLLVGSPAYKTRAT